MDLAPDVTPEDLEVFLQEADEQLRLLDEDVVRLEREPDAGELLQEIFRAAHTLKGSSGMLGYKEMAELAHHMEHLLDLFRTGALAVTTPAVDALLHSLDAMRVLRDELADPTGRSLDVSAAVAELAQAAGASAEGEPGAKDAGSAPAGAGPAAPIVLGPAARERIADLASGGAQLLAVDVHISADTIWSSVRLFQALQALGDLGEVIASEPSQSAIDSGAPSQLLRAIVSTRSSEDDVRREVGGLDDIAGVEVEPYVPEAVAKDAPDAAGAGQRRTGAGRTQTVRIDVARLDELMNQIGELVIDRTRIVQIGKALEQRYKGDDMVEALGETSAHIVKVVDELQESTRQVRMQPIGTVFSGLPRMVRDLSHKMGKKLDFQVSGSETEIDRTVIERIRDPLIHLLRNAVDHGVELPEERIAAGKPETAVLKLRAYQEQGHIVIVVEDDGRGIDTERVKAAAVKKGLISAEAGARLTEAQAIELIFLPGASTAEKTTEVSGRGVGMDIVRSNVEAINGLVTAETVLGQSTRMTLKLPLTLATLHALLVRAGTTHYAIPLVYVWETTVRNADEIPTIAGREVIRVRDAVVPLTSLSEAFGLSRAEHAAGSVRQVVVVRLGERLLGLSVDAFSESQEIVVKPLGGFLGDVKGIGGVSVLGDGQVVLIVDIPSLVNSIMARGPAEEPVAVA